MFVCAYVFVAFAVDLFLLGVTFLFGLSYLRSTIELKRIPQSLVWFIWSGTSGGSTWYLGPRLWTLGDMSALLEGSIGAWLPGLACLYLQT